MVRAAAAFVLLFVLGGVAAAQTTQSAIFAGGCFWCVESDFDKAPGVKATVSGYIGGQNDNPTYQNHSQFRHREAVKIDYDPAQVSYEQLLRIFFRSVDPTDAGGQFCDRGFSYTTAVYALDDAQLAQAEAAKQEAAAALGTALATEITPAPTFWPAEDYHQDYYAKNPLRYAYYRSACGRDAKVRQVWGAARSQACPAPEAPGAFASVSL
jgi:peptide-methionine (S)-S-oxide reductase